uniref:LsmAD domain-containing protein n=1 Tax=Meloidogyne javanica TaxID=6303 RepID=A0A915M0L5_MELJA
MSLKDHADKMVGTQVFVEDESGDIFKGLLRGFSAVDQLEVELVSVYKVIFVSESKFSLTRLGKNETMKVVATRISGDSEPGNARTFRTDSKIAATKNLNNGENEHLDMSDTELDLQEWEDDGCGEYGAIESINCVVDELDSLGGWSVTDMFQANKDKCVGNGTVFDESEFSNVGIGEHSKEVLEKAQALAQQISMNPASRHNAQLENDDEERDLDAATKFDANEKSQRGGGKFNDERKQRQVMDKVSLSATKMIEYKKDDGKYEKKPFTSEKKIHSQKVMTSELNDIRKGGNKKFEKEKKVDAIDVSPPPEPLPPQNVKAPTPIQSRKNSGGGRASVDRAVSVQSSEQGDKGESLVVYNNNTIGTTTSTNNLATIATNFGNNFMTNQVATFVPVPAASLQQFQYAQLQHQPPIAQAQVPLTHQPMLTNHNLSQSPSVQPQQQHVQQVSIPATVHQQQHIFQQQQQAAGFYATGTDSANLSGYVLNWGATAGNNFMANQVTTFAPVPAASLQQFQYAQLPHQPPIAQTQPPPTHHTMPPNHTLSRSPSVQAQQQHVQQGNIQFL